MFIAGSSGPYDVVSRELGAGGNEQREAPGQRGATEGDDHGEHDEEADDPHESNSLARRDHYLGFGEHRRREG